MPQASGWPARALAEAGHRVLTLDIDADAIAQFQNEFGEGSAVVCDVANAAQVEAAFHCLVDPHQRVDVLFNNAGIAGPQQPLEDIEVAAWQSTIDTDLNSVFYLTFGDSADEISAQRSHFNMSSSAAVTVAQCAPPTWQPSGSDWARSNLGHGAGPLEYQVNALCPQQERIDRVIDRDAAERGVTPDEIRKVYQRQSCSETL